MSKSEPAKPEAAKPESAEKPKSAPKSGPKPQSGDSRRGAIAGLIIAAVLLGVGLWLARDLTAASKLQDCLMTGRTNCAVIPAQ